MVSKIDVLEVTLVSASGDNLSHQGTYQTFMEIGKLKLPTDFHAVSLLNQSVILGGDFLCKYSVTLDCGTNIISEASKSKSAALLLKYDDHFLKYDFDLGQTDLLKATIKTSDAEPIRQKPY